MEVVFVSGEVAHFCYQTLQETLDSSQKSVKYIRQDFVYIKEICSLSQMAMAEGTQTTKEYCVDVSEIHQHSVPLSSVCVHAHA